MNYLKHFLSLVAFLFLATAVDAHADTMTGISAAGDTFNLYITTSPDSDGVAFIDFVSGTATINGVTQAVNAIIPTSAPGVVTYTADGYFYFDDLLFTGSGNPFDSPGLAFTLMDGTEVNLFYNDGSPGSGLICENNGYSSGLVSVTYTPTPEPSGLILLGTGMLGAAGAARQRFKR